MPNYRGVEQADLISSINDALELLETHSPGPECQKLIDAMRAVDPVMGTSKLGAVAHAATDVELADAIRNSGANWLFICEAEVLQYHAIYNTDGRGLDVLERLQQWNGGGGARVAAYYPIDGEADAWLAMSYARRVEATEENGEKIAGVLDALAQSPEELAVSGAALKELVSQAAKGADDEELKKIFLDLDLRHRHIVKGTLSVLALDGAQANLEFDNPMGRFGVVVDDLTTGRINWTDKSIEELRRKIEETLAPFWRTDEVNMTGIGLILNSYPAEDGVNPQGVIFGGSKRAAQAVADALPDQTVMDGQGRKIAPKTMKPLPPKPGFSL